MITTPFVLDQINQNDGVVVYIKKLLQGKFKEVGLINASCRQQQSVNTILCIYRSPSNINATGFIESLSSHLDSLTGYNNIIIAGDINVNIAPTEIKPTHEYNNRANYLSALSSCRILAGHTIPTRGYNCLDHYMLKINKRELSIYCGLANHCNRSLHHPSLYL